MHILPIARGEADSPPGILIGTCPVDHDALSGHKKNIENILPGTTHVVVVAVAHTRAALRSANVQVKQYDTIYTYQRVCDLSMELAREIEHEGYEAVAVPAFIPIDMLGEGKGMKGELCWRRAAVAAGLGWIGKNGLLVTNDFGSRVRIGGVVTTYPLNRISGQTEPHDRKNSCDGCSACLARCPVGALTGSGIDKKKCGDYIFSYGLRRFTSYLGRLATADEQEQRELLKSDTVRELWQNFMTGNYYYCWECQASCPVGK